MSVRTVRLCSVMILASAGLLALRADTLSVGTANPATPSAAPFGDDAVTAYQQLYSNTYFSGLPGEVNLSELDFFVDPSAIPIYLPDNTLQPYAGQFQVTLYQFAAGSVTNADLATSILSDTGGTNANTTATLNLTTDSFGQVTSGMLALTLNFVAQLDPTEDLVLDVQQVGAAPWTLFALQADDHLDSVGIASDCSAAVCDYGVGLVTNFIETPVVSTIPEPSTLALLAVGLFLLGIASGRRSRARA